MSLTTRVGTIVGAVALTAGVVVADDAGANNETQAQIAALQARIAELEAGNSDDWMTEKRAEEIRGVVHDVLADADTRSSLMQSGANAGYDNGFFIGTADGNWSLKINGQLQVRYVYNHLDGALNPNTDKDRAGFENTRTKLIFSGNIVDPSWTYKIETNFARGDSFAIDSVAIDPATDEITSITPSSVQSGGNLVLEDAWIRWDYGSGWAVKFGQFRLPYARETLVYSGHQLAVERSDLAYVYGLGFSQGIMLEYESDAFRGAFAYSDGTGFTSSGYANTAWSQRTSEVAFTLRGEYKAAGTWDQFKDYTSWAEDETGVLIGAAINYEIQEFGDMNNELQKLGVTADVQAEFGGSNLFAAFYYQNLELTNSAKTDQFGFVVQGGFMFADAWEGFARYEYSDYNIAGADDLGILTIGVNKYFSKHNVKWTTDVLWGTNGISAAYGNTITGTRPDDGQNKDQFAVRTQLQLMF